MFDLNQAIANWRRELAARGISSRDQLDELECHLRDDLLEQLGPQSEPAFEAAVRRLGTPEALRAEFAKVRWRPNWFVLACLAFPILCLSRRAYVLVHLFSF